MNLPIDTYQYCTSWKFDCKIDHVESYALAYVIDYVHLHSAGAPHTSLKDFVHLHSAGAPHTSLKDYVHLHSADAPHTSLKDYVHL